MDHLSSVTSSTGALPRFDFARKASLSRLFRGGHDALGVVFGRSPITRGQAYSSGARRIVLVSQPTLTVHSSEE